MGREHQRYQSVLFCHALKSWQGTRPAHKANCVRGGGIKRPVDASYGNTAVGPVSRGTCDAKPVLPPRSIWYASPMFFTILGTIKSQCMNGQYTCYTAQNFRQNMQLYTGEGCSKSGGYFCLGHILCAAAPACRSPALWGKWLTG